MSKYDYKKEEFRTILESKKGDFIANEDVRKKALDFYTNSHFPTLKTEDWRHTNLSELFEHQYNLPIEKEYPEGTFDEFHMPCEKCNRLVFINGFYSEKHSVFIENSKSLQIGNIKDLDKNILNEYLDSSNISQNNTFTALNTAFAENGAFVHIHKNQILELPIHILNIVDNSTEKNIIQNRNLIIADKNSQATIIERYYSLEKEGKETFCNIANEIFVNENAEIDYTIYQYNNNKTFMVNQMNAIQKRDSRFTCNSFTMKGKFIRNDIIVAMNDENCNVKLNGLYLAEKEEHFDNFTNIIHAKPNCNSKTNYRGIADDNSSAVFLGKVYVAKDAQKTDAQQSNKNILLSEKAKINSKPQLEIYADDVSCSHGSTTGQLDTEALFYLQTRGIEKNQAQSLLLYAFASDIVKQLKVESLRKRTDKEISEYFHNEIFFDA